MILLFIHLTLLQAVAVHSTCTTSVEGSALTRHSYRSFASGDMMACYQHCRSEEPCQSINYHRDKGICELNNRTDAVSPGNFVGKEDAYYFSNPFRAQLGSSENVPALSCQEIKKSSSEAALSGRYWLASPGSEMSRSAFCNMTTGVVVECTGNPCNNGGTCDYQGSGQYTCSCQPGYTGVHCEKDIDECADRPCLNGGVCADEVNSFTCSCTVGFTGSRCELHPAVECNVYKNLSEANRNVNVQSSPALCDKLLLTADWPWYRFTGSAGTKMPTSCIGPNKCTTHATGWLNGSDPTVNEGRVSRQVCFHWSNNCCNWKETIQVRNCGAYFVYKLVKTAQCSLRYCAT